MVKTLRGVEKLKIGEDTVNYTCGSGVVKDVPWDSYGAVLISKNVEKIFSGKLKEVQSDHILYMDDGEHTKNIDAYEQLCKTLLEKNVERTDSIAYIGGGTLGDLVGFAASTYKRGIRYDAVPTTLLSMVDSSIGGKNGINFAGIKNIIGTFKNPGNIVADTEFISGNKELVGEGMAEIVKHAYAIDYSLMDFLMKNDPESIINGDKIHELIIKNAKVKADVCNSDPYELNGKRFVLNFGHTIAHGIEAASHNNISHGKAVFYGMIFEMNISKEMNVIEYDPFPSMEYIIDVYGIKMPRVDEKVLAEAWAYISNDKKIRGGNMMIPMAKTPGVVVLKSIKMEELRELFFKVVGIMVP
jgi:3-dehydroquinate synthase